MKKTLAKITAPTGDTMEYVLCHGVDSITQKPDYSLPGWVEMLQNGVKAKTTLTIAEAEASIAHCKEAGFKVEA